MNKQHSHRTAVALGVAFRTKPPRATTNVPRTKRIITRKDSWGMAFQMLSFNEAKKLLASQGILFETDVELENALWRGMKIKDGGMLRDSFFHPQSVPTKFED